MKSLNWMIKRIHFIIDTKELYIEKLAAKTGNAETLVDLLLVGKYLERICDHAVNIAKWVLFQKKGVYEE